MRTSQSLHVLPDSAWSWVICFGNVLASFSSLGIYRCLGLFYPAVMSEFNVNYVEVSLVSGLFTGSMSFGSLFLVLVKWVGLRKIGMGTNLLLSISLFVASQSTSITMFVVTCGALCGFCGGLSVSLIFLSISIYYNKHRSKAAGLTTAGLSVGGLVAAPTLSALVGEYGWRGAMLITSAVTLHACVGAALYRPVARADAEANTDATDDVSLTKTPTSDKSAWSARIKAIFDYTLFSRPVYVFAFVSSMTYWSAMVGTTFLIIPLGMESMGLDRTAASILLACQSAGDLVGRVMGGLIGDCREVNNSILLGVTTTLGTVSTYAITLSGNYALQCVLAFVLGVTYAPFGSLFVGLYTEVFGPEKMTHALSYEGFVSTILTLPMTYLLGIIIDTTGEVRIAYYVCGVFMALTSTSIYIIYILQRRNAKAIFHVRNVTAQSVENG